MLTVLIVEDDLIIADMVEEQLTADGFKVCGIATTIAEALILAREFNPDCALIDVRLRDGDMGTDLARDLKNDRTIGILYATGNLDAVLYPIGTECFRQPNIVGEACIMKPYNFRTLGDCITLTARIVRTGTITGRKPDGLFILPLIGAASDDLV